MEKNLNADEAWILVSLITARKPNKDLTQFKLECKEDEEEDEKFEQMNIYQTLLLKPGSFMYSFWRSFMSLLVLV